MMPIGKRLRRLAELAVKGRQTLSSEGMGAFVWKLKSKIRRRLNTTKRVRRRHQKQLQRILARGTGKGVVVFFPTVDWGWMVQRPHQLIREFARKGYLCFFVTAQTRVDKVDGFCEVEPNLYLCADLLLLQDIESPILLLSSTHHLSDVQHFRNPILVYDYLDTLEVTAGGAVTDRKVREHEALLRHADVVLATARRLHAEARGVRPDTVLVPNGADAAHFAPRPSVDMPRDLAPIVAKGRPIFGYYGAMAEWFDYDLIRYAAAAMPACDFVFLGPDYDGSIARLEQRENVHYLGLKSYEELPGYLQRFDVAMIPFRINEITRATSPVKLFEYMAGRKPIVTTAMDEAFNYRSVLVGDSPESFVSQLSRALELRTDDSYLALLEAECAENTWSQRVEGIVAALEERQPSRRDTYVILAGVPIDDSGGGQRPAQLALELLARGARVLYVSKFPKQESTELGQRVAHPLLETHALEHFVPLRHLPQAGDTERLVGILEMPHPEFLGVADAIRARGGTLIYDLIDDWQTSLGGSWYRLDVDNRLIERSQVLLASAQDLQDQLKVRTGRAVTLVPNAVNLDLFRRDRAYARPSDLIVGQGTVLYVGALWGEWFDWDLLREVAQAHPNASIVAIGEHLGRCPYPLLPNMTLLGLKAQRDLPAYLAHADVAIIPFKVSRLTQAVSPLKVFEYLAMAKPVVATQLRELVGLPHVHLAATPSQFVSLVGEAMDEPVDEAAIARFVAGNSWSNRVDVLLASCAGDVAVR